MNTARAKRTTSNYVIQYSGNGFNLTAKKRTLRDIQGERAALEKRKKAWEHAKLAVAIQAKHAKPGYEAGRAADLNDLSGFTIPVVPDDMRQRGLDALQSQLVEESKAEVAPLPDRHGKRKVPLDEDSEDGDARWPTSQKKPRMTPEHRPLLKSCAGSGTFESV